MRKLCSFVIAVLLFQACQTSRQQEALPLQLDFEPDGQTIAITANGELLTLYRFADTLYKPLFFPVNTINGITISRGYPFDPRPYEPVDHPHQTGMWFTFGDVNGIDFWNNSDAIPAGKKASYGHIVTDSIQIDQESGDNCGFTAFNSWLDHDGNTLLNEKARYRFSASGDRWSVKRHTVLVAETEIHFGDNKEGLFAIRLAREFQSDFDTPVIILNRNLYPGLEKTINNQGKNGFFFSSSGLEGQAVWGTANKWVAVEAAKDSDSISVVIFDHPENPGFPSHWHARNYGLFSVNNLGRQAFIDTLPPLTMELAMNDSLMFMHELVVKSSGFITRKTIDSLYHDFSILK